MAWTAPLLWVTGTLVTAAQLNLYISDNDAYLKSQTDKLNLLKYNDVSAARAGDVEYQNGANPRFIIMTFHDTGTTNWEVTFLIGSASPAAWTIARYDGDTDYNVSEATISVMVPPLYFYKLNIDTDTTIDEWIEMDFHTT